MNRREKGNHCSKAKWRENYTKHAKTFVRVGEPGDDSSWKEPVGMAFEIVPEQDPIALSSGARLTIRLVKDGKPLPDSAVGLVAANAKAGSIQKTDREDASLSSSTVPAGGSFVPHTSSDPRSPTSIGRATSRP